MSQGRDPSATPPDVTRLLQAWSEGDRGALDRLLPLVQSELRRLAGAYLRRERAGHTLQPTALVNEAYLRLVDQRVHWQSRSHFFGIAARLMRRVLVDHARERLAQKRGSGERAEPIEVAEAEGSGGRPLDVVALDDALEDLAKVGPRQCQVVELRFFGGLSIEEAADVLGVSPRTVKSDWTMARAWLLRYLGERGGAA
jgi:RNA polymerase sigma-70 factor (ECF subfamily)